MQIGDARCEFRDRLSVCLSVGLSVRIDADVDASRCQVSTSEMVSKASVLIDEMEDVMICTLNNRNEM